MRSTKYLNKATLTVSGVVASLLKAARSPILMGVMAIALLTTLSQQSFAQLKGASSAGGIDAKGKTDPATISVNAKGNEFIYAAAGDRLGDTNDFRIVSPPTTPAATVPFPANIFSSSFIVPSGVLKGQRVPDAGFLDQPKFPVNPGVGNTFTYDLQSEMMVSRATANESDRTTASGVSFWETVFTPGNISDTRTSSLNATATVSTTPDRPVRFPGTAASVAQDPWVFTAINDTTIEKILRSRCTTSPCRLTIPSQVNLTLHQSL
jgi:hypothetical protein